MLDYFEMNSHKYDCYKKSYTLYFYFREIIKIQTSACYSLNYVLRNSKEKTNKMMYFNRRRRRASGGEGEEGGRGEGKGGVGKADTGGGGGFGEFSRVVRKRRGSDGFMNPGLYPRSFSVFHPLHLASET